MVFIHLGDMRSKSARGLWEMAEGGEIRHRKKGETLQTEELPSDSTTEKKDMATGRLSLKPGSYWLTRIVLLRSIGFVYSKFWADVFRSNWLSVRQVPGHCVSVIWICFRKEFLRAVWIKSGPYMYEIALLMEAGADVNFWANPSWLMPCTFNFVLFDRTPSVCECPVQWIILIDHLWLNLGVSRENLNPVHILSRFDVSMKFEKDGLC